MARPGRSYAAVAIVNRFRGETTKPTYSVALHVTASTDSTVDLAATATDDLAGALDHFAGIYEAGSTPTAADVVAGSGSGFVAGGSKLAVASGVQATFDQITGIPHNGHPYRIASTVRDGYGNLATVAYIDWFSVVGAAARGELTVTGFVGVLLNERTITVPYPLALRNGTVRSNLTGLHWAWFDQDDAGTLAAPTDQGTAETTDASGNIAIGVSNSVLSSGQYGRLVVETSDKVSTAMFRVAMP